METLSVRGQIVTVWGPYGLCRNYLTGTAVARQPERMCKQMGMAVSQSKFIKHTHTHTYVTPVLEHSLGSL